MTVSTKRTKIKYSSYKLNACAIIARKRPLSEAMDLLHQCPKKGARIVEYLVRQARTFAKQKGYADERLWVKEVFVGRALG